MAITNAELLRSNTTPVCISMLKKTQLKLKLKHQQFYGIGWPMSMLQLTAWFLVSCRGNKRQAVTANPVNNKRAKNSLPTGTPTSITLAFVTQPSFKGKFMVVKKVVMVGGCSDAGPKAVWGDAIYCLVISLKTINRVGRTSLSLDLWEVIWSEATNAAS